MAEDTYADQVIHEALTAATGGLDGARVRHGIEDVIEAFLKQAEALKQAAYRPEDYERIARAMAHEMKTVDGYARLLEFLAGRPDSRRGWVLGDWMRLLTDEQFKMLQGWVEQSAERTRSQDAGARRRGAGDA